MATRRSRLKVKPNIGRPGGGPSTTSGTGRASTGASSRSGTGALNKDKDSASITSQDDTGSKVQDHGMERRQCQLVCSESPSSPRKRTTSSSGEVSSPRKRRTSGGVEVSLPGSPRKRAICSPGDGNTSVAVHRTRSISRSEDLCELPHSPRRQLKSGTSDSTDNTDHNVPETETSCSRNRTQTESCSGQVNKNDTHDIEKMKKNPQQEEIGKISKSPKQKLEGKNDKSKGKESENSGAASDNIEIQQKETDKAIVETKDKPVNHSCKPANSTVRRRFNKAKPNVGDSGRHRVRHMSASGSEVDGLNDYVKPPPVTRVVGKEISSVSELATTPKSSDNTAPLQSAALPASVNQDETVAAIEKHPVRRTTRASEEDAPKKKRRKMEKLTTIDRTKLTMQDLIYMNPVQNPMKSTLEKAEKLLKQREAEESASARNDVHSADDIDDEADGRSESAAACGAPRRNESVDTLGSDGEGESEKTPAKATKQEEEEEEDLMVPQVKIGADGQIILNEASLVVDNPNNSVENVDMKLVHENEGSFSCTYQRKTHTKSWSLSETKKFYLALSAVGTDFSLMDKLFPQRSRTELKRKFKREDKVNRCMVDKAIAGDRQIFDLAFFKEVAAFDVEAAEAEEKREKEEQRKRTASLNKKQKSSETKARKTRRTSKIEEGGDEVEGKKSGFRKRRESKPGEKKKKKGRSNKTFLYEDSESENEDKELPLEDDPPTDSREKGDVENASPHTSDDEEMNTLEHLGDKPTKSGRQPKPCKRMNIEAAQPKKRRPKKPLVMPDQAGPSNASPGNLQGTFASPTGPARVRRPSESMRTPGEFISISNISNVPNVNVSNMQPGSLVFVTSNPSSGGKGAQDAGSSPKFIHVYMVSPSGRLGSPNPQSNVSGSASPAVQPVVHGISSNNARSLLNSIPGVNRFVSQPSSSPKRNEGGTEGVAGSSISKQVNRPATSLNVGNSNTHLKSPCNVTPSTELSLLPGTGNKPAITSSMSGCVRLDAEKIISDREEERDVTNNASLVNSLEKRDSKLHDSSKASETTSLNENQVLCHDSGSIMVEENDYTQFMRMLSKFPHGEDHGVDDYSQAGLISNSDLVRDNIAASTLTIPTSIKEGNKPSIPTSLSVNNTRLYSGSEVGDREVSNSSATQHLKTVENFTRGQHQSPDAQSVGPTSFTLLDDQKEEVCAAQQDSLVNSLEGDCDVSNVSHDLSHSNQDILLPSPNTTLSHDTTLDMLNETTEDLSHLDQGLVNTSIVLVDEYGNTLTTTAADWQASHSHLDLGCQKQADNTVEPEIAETDQNQTYHTGTKRKGVVEEVDVTRKSQEVVTPLNTKIYQSTLGDSKLMPESSAQNVGEPICTTIHSIEPVEASNEVIHGSCEAIEADSQITECITSVEPVYTDVSQSTPTGRVCEMRKPQSPTNVVQSTQTIQSVPQVPFSVQGEKNPGSRENSDKNFETLNGVESNIESSHENVRLAVDSGGVEYESVSDIGNNKKEHILQIVHTASSDIHGVEGKNSPGSMLNPVIVSNERFGGNIRDHSVSSTSASETLSLTSQTCLQSDALDVMANSGETGILSINDVEPCSPESSEALDTTTDSLSQLDPELADASIVFVDEHGNTLNTTAAELWASQSRLQISFSGHDGNDNSALTSDSSNIS